MQIPLQVATLIVLFFFSALFSASETALFSLSKLKLRQIKNKHPEGHRTIAHLLDHPRRTLITILTGNSIVNITATSLVTALGLQVFGRRGLGFSIVFMTMTLLLVGEMVPKSIAIRNAEKISILVSWLLEIIARLIRPLCLMLQAVANLFLRILLGKPGVKEPFVTQDELESLITISEREGVIDKDEEEMIQTVFGFSEREVNEIMVPRVDIVAVEINTPRSILVELLRKERFARIPVYEKTIDKIKGVIVAREVMLKAVIDWKKYIREVSYVPETMKIEDLFILLQNRTNKLAVVVDEHGGTAGVVTMEDILEELVGEIEDEHDTTEILVRKIGDNKWCAMGKTTLWDLKDDYGINIEDERAETIGGFVVNLFGRIPGNGEEISYKNLRFRIGKVKDNRIHQVFISRRSDV